MNVVELRTASPTVLVALLKSGPTNETGISGSPDVIDLTNWKINGVPPKSIHRYSIPWDEGKPDTSGNPDLYPVTVLHKIYLELEQPIQNGRAYMITSPYGMATLWFDDRVTYCESIHANQVGYSKLSTSRFANFGVFMGDGETLTLPAPPLFHVVEETTGLVVAIGEGVVVGEDTGLSGPKSGEFVYRLLLNDVQPGGPYFISIPGCGRSRSFGVGDKYTKKIAETVMRGLFHQRCGQELAKPFTDFTRGKCHSLVADTKVALDSNYAVPGPYGIHVPPGTPTRPMAGGYHDAGNFQRRAQHVIIPIILLSTFESWPTHFKDKQYNLPESGNGVPDYLNEAMWGVLALENLQILNAVDPEFGGVQSGTMEDHQPGYGVESAASSPQITGTFQVTPYVTAYAAGIFAQASRLINSYDTQRSARLLTAARRAWDYIERSTDERAVKTMNMYASLQLFLATGEQKFHDIFKEIVSKIVLGGGPWPETYLPGNTTATCQTVHFVSYLLPAALPVADAALVTSLKNKILGFAETGGYMEPHPEGRPYPQGVNKFYAWGASTAQGRYSDVYQYGSLFTTDPAKKQKYINAVSLYSDYALGLNPMGMSYYTGLGTDQPNSPLHLDSYFPKMGLSDGVTQDHVGKPIGNVPGMLIYGPTESPSGALYQQAVTKKMFPAFTDLPTLRRFAHGWSNVNSNEFTTWETIVWAASMFGFLYDASADLPPPPPPPVDPGPKPAAEYRVRDYVLVDNAWVPEEWKPVKILRGFPAILVVES